MAKKRKKLWEMEDRFHCSLVGTCLDLAELKRLGGKVGLSRDVLADDYRLHSAFVGIVGERGWAARLVGKYLDRKYRRQIRSTQDIDNEKGLQKAWKEAVVSGEVAEAYWALLTHPSATDRFKYKIYGEVHMLSHLSGASVRVNMERLRRLRRQVAELESRLLSQRRERQRVVDEKNREIQELHGRLSEMQARLSRLKRQRARLEQGRSKGEAREEKDRQIQRLRKRLERAEAETGKWQALAESWQAEKEQHRRLAEQALQERDALEYQLDNLLASDCDGCDNATSCERNLDLCNRQILLVGGRSRQCAHFRVLVERKKGCFLHHDGGLEESSRRLSSLLVKADAVLCPLDCVSHEAVHRIKQECKRHGKPLQLLPRASLAAFTRGLREVVAG